MSSVLSLCGAPMASAAGHVGGWDVHLLGSEHGGAGASSKAGTSTIYGLLAVKLNELLTSFELICA